MCLKKLCTVLNCDIVFYDLELPEQMADPLLESVARGMIHTP